MSARSRRSSLAPSPTNLSRPDRSAWRSPLRLFLLAGLLASLIYASAVAVLPRRYGHIVGGDGLFYYVYLRSAVLDGNLDFTDEYQEFNRAITDPGKLINTTLRTPTGLALNQFSVGPALLAAPLFLLAHALSLAGHRLGLPLPLDGYGLLYEGSFALTGVLAGVAGAACAYAALRRILPAGPAGVGVAGIWLGGSLLYYTLASPVYAHAFSALGVAVWLLLWSRLRPTAVGQWLVLGLAGGLMATMRWQEALIAPLPLLWWAIDRWWPARSSSPVTTPQRTKAAGGPFDQPPMPEPTSAPAQPLLAAPLLYGLGLVLGFSPQLVAWTILFGQPLAVPQTGAFFTWGQPHWLEVLISPRNGLFSWTPVALLAVVGLVGLLRQQPRWAVMGLLAIVLQVAINGLLFDWWGGAAFGARRFLGTAVFQAAGLGWLAAQLWPARRRLTLWLLLLVIGLNGLLMLQYTAALRGWTRLDPVPTLGQLTVERFTWPLDWLRQRR
jgi:hypothetical protein